MPGTVASLLDVIANLAAYSELVPPSGVWACILAHYSTPAALVVER